MFVYLSRNRSLFFFFLFFFPSHVSMRCLCDCLWTCVNQHFVWVCERVSVCVSTTPSHMVSSRPCVVWPPVLKPINPTYTDSSHAVAVPRPTGITPFALKGSILFEERSVGLVNTHPYLHPNIWNTEEDGASRSCQLFHINCMTVTPWIVVDCYPAVLAYQIYQYCCICCLTWNLFLEISLHMHLDL